LAFFQKKFFFFDLQVAIATTITIEGKKKVSLLPSSLFYLNSFGCFLSQKNNHLVLIAIKKKVTSSSQ
jgi:hypothetical protein